MGDLISRHAVLDAVETIGFDFSDSDLSEVELEEVCEAIGEVRQTWLQRIKRLPSVEPERKQGKWHLLDECSNEGWYCDQCHKKMFKVDFSNTMRKYKFYPNCGAKMEEVDR